MHTHTGQSRDGAGEEGHTHSNHKWEAKVRSRDAQRRSNKWEKWWERGRTQRRTRGTGIPGDREERKSVQRVFPHLRLC